MWNEGRFMRSCARILIHATLLLLNGCSLAGASAPRLPYDAWYLGFQAPSSMEVWLETADVQDIRERVFPGVMAGTVSMGYGGNPAGWGKVIPMGKGRDVVGADLPKRIYLRWQSLVEPQTYATVLEIPASARELMRSKVPSERAPVTYDYPRVLSIALAPGGWVKAWVMSSRSEPIAILCQQAQIEPKGPYQGQNNGIYAYAFDQLEPATQRYLKTHSIPYDSWRCPGAEAASTTQGAP
jgi:hypothetical protein